MTVSEENSREDKAEFKKKNWFYASHFSEAVRQWGMGIILGTSLILVLYCL